MIYMLTQSTIGDSGVGDSYPHLELSAQLDQHLPGTYEP